MGKEIKIKITPDGKVEIDSTVFKDCKEVAEHLSKVIGKVEVFTIKEEHEREEKLRIKKGDK
ncbi:MAG: hypothetical protein OEV59_03855 [Deltaproteobacteria bacterium]|nr:hypothetical protein [Deltaproteobacteria bacterium]